MKILAIRGENLASLPRFELDLSSGPLGEAGLFAIAGPTGAGKSTLLDALCLALYDTTPRLRGEGAQHILRQSAVEACAEVDFRCDQGRRFRATWRVQRARKKPDGRWQEQTLQLVELETGKQLGDHRKRETLRLIEDQVGLSFDQFRRAVLLAQGDFALFLQAKGDERAKLLEKITGAEIYARLSEAAFRRCKEERERLQTLRAEAERYPVLSDEERGQREAERERLRLLRAELLREVDGRKRDCDWHRTRGRLAAELAQAEAELASARVRWDDGAALREEIGAYERALAARPALLGADAATRRLREAVAEHEAAAQRLGRAAEAGDQARAALEGAERALGEARAQQAARGPELGRARELDLRTGTLAARVREATEEAQAAAAAHDAERRREAAIAGRIIEGGRRAAELDDWLGARAALGAVAAQWPRWRGELRGAGAAWRRLCGLERDGGGRERRLQQAEVATQATQAARREAEGRRQAARQELEATRGRLAAHEAAHPAEALRQRRAALAGRLQRLAEARRLAAEIGRIDEELGAAQAQARDETTRGEACRAEAAALLAELGRVRQERDACDRDLALLRATQELAARRPELLVPGHPCPLCGAREHPHADEPAPAAAGVRRLQEMLDELRASAEALQEREASLRQEGHARGVLATQAQARARTLAATRRTQGDALGAHLGELGMDAGLEGLAETGRAQRRPDARQGALPFGPEVEDSLARRMEGRLEEAERATRAEQAALEAEAQAGEALRREHAARLEAHGRAAEELERHAADDAAAAAERADAERALALHREQLEGARALWQRSAEGLEGALAFRPRWREELGASTEALEAALARDVAAWEEQSRRRAQAEEEARALQGQLLQSQQALQLLGEAQRQKQAQREACAGELEGLRRERVALLGGRSVPDCVAELEAAVAWADEALGRARSAGAAAQEERAAAEEAVTAARRRLGQAEEERRQAQAQLAAAAAGAGLAEAELRQALACDEAVHDERRRRLQTLREALTEAEVRVADRRRRLEEHGATAAPALPQPACEAALAEGSARLDATQNELFHVELTLGQDEQTRASRARAEEGVLTRQAQVESWERLSDLIGSADGKKFRQFAQSLTLDILLEHTNHHLRQLRPRYRIERLRGADMELQVVDRDMGGEVRSCATLSGGESFLVSLALALGLSSLSSRDVRVESLFIDEGFGTLDRDTLELAIATLEQLQADGRQVGLISHVSELADRIGYQVLVRPRHAGHSTVTVSDGRR